MMLIKDLDVAERNLVTAAAARRTRPLWDDSAEAGLAHGVFAQLLLDLAAPSMHDSALRDWESRRDHWYANGFGVDQVFLTEQLQHWSFIGEGSDLSNFKREPFESVMEGTRFCTVCEQELPVTEFHRFRKGKGGRHAQCGACRRKKMRKHGDDR